MKLLGYPAKELQSLSIQQLIYAEDRTKFESVMLFIKTGFDGLGNWRFRCKDGSPLHATISSKAIREQQVFLISFQNIEGQIKAEEELLKLNQKLMFEVGRHTRQLETKNEELAYRASQTQHINEELILVNEQLSSVNKKIAAERDLALARSMALEHFIHVTCSFDLADKTSCLISDNADELFDDCRVAPDKPWFWLDYVHPEDVSLVESSQRRLSADKESSCLYRIKTKNGETRVVFNHLRILEKKGSNVLIGSFVDVSRFATMLPHTARLDKV